jgi:hypothetical protein
MDLNATVYENENWIRVAQQRIQQALVITVTKQRVPYTHPVCNHPSKNSIFKRALLLQVKNKKEYIVF